MNPVAFLAHARTLANQGSPAECRSAISRAYYAAFHAGLGFLHALRVQAPGAGPAHAAVGAALLSIPQTLDSAVRDAGVMLSLLLTERQCADYQWHDLRTEQPSRALLFGSRAEAVLLALTTCQANAARMAALTRHFQAWVPTTGQRLGLSLLP